VGFATLAIFKYLHLHADRVLVPQVSGQLNFLMNRVVAPDESPDETDYDDSRRGQGCAVFGAVRRRNGIRYQKTQYQGTRYQELRDDHPGR